MTTSLLNFRVRQSSEWRALDVSPKLLKTPRTNDKVPGGLRRVGSETLSAELRTPAHVGFGAEETPGPEGRRRWLPPNPFISQKRSLGFLV